MVSKEIWINVSKTEKYNCIIWRKNLSNLQQIPYATSFNQMFFAYRTEPGFDYSNYELIWF